MKNSPIIPLTLTAVVLAAVAASKDGKDDSPSYTTLTKDDTQNATPDLTPVSHASSSTNSFSIAQVKAVNKPNVSKRKEWADKYTLYLNQNSGDVDLAMALIWQDWTSSPFFDLFPNVKALFFSLATYIPDRAENINKDDAISNAPRVIEWNDAPLYEDLYCAWDCKDYWVCADWIAWHRALEQHFGDTYKANDIWMAAWQDPQNQCAILASVWCPDTDGCRYNCDFVKYFYSKGITIGNVLSNVYCDLSNVVLNIVQTTSNVSTAVSNISEGVKDTSTLFKTAMPFVGGFFLVAIGKRILKN